MACRNARLGEAGGPKAVGIALALSLLLLLSSMPAASSAVVRVQEISDLNVSVTVGDPSHLRYDITIRNTIDSPIVPGIGEVKLQAQHPMKVLGVISIPFTHSISGIEVYNLRAHVGDRPIGTYVEQGEGCTTIKYELWYPLMPNSTIPLTIEYDADITEGGLLFEVISIPLGADVDIRRFEVVLVSDLSTTHATPPMTGGKWMGSLRANEMVVLTAELSKLPLPMMPVNGYLVLWGLVMVIIVGLIVRIARKK
ncbi:MAG: hypothetical protein ACXQT3_03300 [Methermicoccaceae archaeon]